MLYEYLKKSTCDPGNLLLMAYLEHSYRDSDVARIRSHWARACGCMGRRSRSTALHPLPWHCYDCDCQRHIRPASIWHAYTRVECCVCIGRRLLHGWNGVYDVVAGKSRSGERSSAVHRPAIFCLAMGFGRPPAWRPFAGYRQSGLRPR